MTIIVEDGSIVPDANSYLTIAEANTLLDDTFGIVPIVALTEKDLKLATQYLESFASEYQGFQVSPAAQSLQFPRNFVYINCVPVPSDSIPTTLKTAQALAAYEQSIGHILQPTNSGQAITQKSIAGQISVSYADNGLGGQLIFKQINQYLKALFNKQNSQLNVFRI